MVTWYPNGPPITHLPFPVLDDTRPGHFTTMMFNTENEDDLRKIIKPPSTVLKEKFSELGGLVTDDTSVYFKGSESSC